MPNNVGNNLKLISKKVLILISIFISARNLLKVSFKDTSRGQSHTLMSNDEHDKRQWLSHLQQAVKASQTNSSDKTDSADNTCIEKGPI